MGTATLQATLSEPQMQSTQFTFRTVSGTAMGGTDYQDIPSGNGTIPPGATFANISIQALNDYYTELGETFSVELLTAAGATIDPAASSVTVTIDDVESGGGGSGGGTTSLALSAPTNVNEGDAFVLTAQMSPPGTYQINAMIDWGATPGAGPTGFSGSTNPDGSFTIGHQYFDDGPAPGNGTPQDVQSITLTGTATQNTMQGPVTVPLSGVTSTTIHNVAPNPVFDIYNYMPIGGPWWKATGVFQDVGLTDRGTAVINWGDGSPDTIFTDLGVGQEFSPEAHRYPRHGQSYTITITLTDDDTGSVSYSKGFTLYLFDLDNDANNSGEINATDEPYEPLTPGVTPPESSIPGPGRYIAVNNDDDNENGVYDYLDAGPVAGEDDLEPIDVIWQKPSRPDIDNYKGWRIILTVWPYSEEPFYQSPRIWLTPDKSDAPLVIRYSIADEYVATWTVGGANQSIPGDRNADELPKRFYVEAGSLGTIGMRLRLRTPGEGNGGQMVEEDYIAFSAAIPTINLRIFNGNEPLDADQNVLVQLAEEVAEDQEFTVGAFTVANSNDTDGDGPSSDGETDVTDRPVLSTFNDAGERRGTDEVDLMLLMIERPVPYFPNSPVQLKTISGNIKLWMDKNKVTPALGNNLTFPYWPDFTPTMGFWVEAVSTSQSVRDIVIEVSHRSAKDTVKATGVWAYQSRFENGTNDWAAIAAVWDELTANQKEMLEYGSNGTGLRPINSFSANVNIQEWTTLPAGLASEPVYVDVSRRVERIAVKQTPGGVWEEFPNWPRKSYPAMKDKANDDLSNDEESTLNIHDHIFTVDATGFPPLLPGTYAAGTKVMYRANFQEFIRFSFRERPAGNAVVGSRGSEFFNWKSKLKAEWDGATWERKGGVGVGTENEVTEGREDIPDLP